MANVFKTDEIASTLLGKKIDGFSQYNPSVLVPVPREENRLRYDIDENNLPFEGYDIWHSYEFSALTEKGLPVTRVLKLRYSCQSPCIIESKSLKLYLNSFNMSKFGKDIDDCLSLCKELITKDLSKVLQTTVIAEFLPPDVKPVEIFVGYDNLTNLSDISNVEFSEYKEAPYVLQTVQIDNITEHFLMFDSLRSNCRVTHQPDFGEAYIYYKSKKVFDYSSLLKYLVSFRAEYHFHEECCEMIYKRLYDLLDEGDELLVAALYTRRGGIDISPVRYSKNLKNSDVELLINLTKFARAGNKQ